MECCLFGWPLIIISKGCSLSAAAKYDAEKAAEEQKERKEKQLKHIEEAKKKAKEQQGVCGCVC